MEEMRKEYMNASVLMAGAACIAMAVNYVVNAASMYESVLPGWSYMCGLCTPVLCTWVGLLLRYRFRNPRWWVQAIVIVAVLFLFYRYRHFLHIWFWWKSNPYLYLAMMGTGYLVPPGLLDEAGRRKGWEYLLLLLVSVFCYTAVSVVNSRLHYMATAPELHEMERLMEQLSNDTEPLIALLSAYFIVMFAFSETGQLIGGKDWFRGLSVVPAVFVFLALSGSLVRSYWRWGTYLLPLLVQPVTVYLAVMVWRRIGRKRSKDAGGSSAG